MPAIAADALAIVGFCNALVKLLGPVQAYVAPVTAGVERLMVAPAHAAGLVAVGVAGIGLTTKFVVPAALVHPFTVTVTL